jgi:hypothetical protein
MIVYEGESLCDVTHDCPYILNSQRLGTILSDKNFITHSVNTIPLSVDVVRQIDIAKLHVDQIIAAPVEPVMAQDPDDIAIASGLAELCYGPNFVLDIVFRKDSKRTD